MGLDLKRLERAMIKSIIKDGIKSAKYAFTCLILFVGACLIDYWLSPQLTGFWIFTPEILATIIAISIFVFTCSQVKHEMD